MENFATFDDFKKHALDIYKLNDSKKLDIGLNVFWNGYAYGAPVIFSHTYEIHKGDYMLAIEFPTDNWHISKMTNVDYGNGSYWREETLIETTDFDDTL